VAATVLSGAVAGSGVRGRAAETVRGGATKAGWRAAALVAAAPLLVHILGLILVRPQIVLGGDQALIELAVRDAARFDTTVGVYSHFGWHHPGPAWLYLLSVPYRIGAAPWSLIAAVLLLNVVWVGLIVRTASRLPRRAAEGTRASWLVALALLALLWSLGTDTFRYVWNPNATILPAVLFLVLCCGVCLRRRGCALGAALVGTFLVQTHVGTVALVGGVGLFVFLARVALPRERHPARVGAPGPNAPASRSSNRRWRQAIAVTGFLLLVLAWVPPLLDQLSGTRNLSKIVDFFVSHHESRSWSGSVSGAGELVDRVFLNRAPNRLTPPLHLAGTAGVVTMAVLLAAAIVLVAAGHGRSRAAQACGVVAVVAMPPAVLAAHGIIGDAGPYLLFWVLAIPVLIGIGWAHFLAAGSARERRTAAAVVWAGLAVATVVAGAVVVVDALDIPTAPPPADAAIGRGVPLLAQQLDPVGHQPVLVTISSARRWPVATGLVLELSRRGWPAYLGGAHAAMFDLAPPHGQRPRLEILVTDVSTRAVRGARDVTPPGSPPLGLYLRTTRG
jgi:cytochrome bd-type quinol oxidase subunit 2